MKSANWEHGLRQRLTLMESGVARISAIKAQLRLNVEQVRKDISSAIDHQLSCIRAREQDLLRQLDQLVAQKEHKLCEQQEQLNQAIGACQQTLDHLQQQGSDGSAVPVDVQAMLLRLNAIELRPREVARVDFEHDPSELRRATFAFGRVAGAERAPGATPMESLPLDVERDEDDALLGLQHKSVLRLLRSPLDGGRAGGGKPAFAHSVSYWLSQAPPLPTGGEDDDFDFIRERLASIASGGGASSFEVLGAPKSEAGGEELFQRHFQELDSHPAEYWLPGGAEAGASPHSLSVWLGRIAVGDAPPPLPHGRPQHKRRIEIPSLFAATAAAAADGVSEVTFDFERVIRAIQRSADEQWLLGGSGGGGGGGGDAQEVSATGAAANKKMRLLDELAPNAHASSADWEQWLAPSSRALGR